MYLLYMENNLLILLKEEGYYGHVISKKLSKDIDNRLYTLIHLIGGMTTQDVYRFAEEATEAEIQRLSFLVTQFPSQQQELLPYAGGYKYLITSPQYKEILKLVKKPKFLREDSGISRYHQDTHEYSNTYDDRSGDMYFSRYIKPEYKEKLFKQWDKLGKADYNVLKLFGIEEDPGMEGYTDFRNVGDVIYPLLVIEWVGGVENTEFAKAPSKQTNEMGFENLKFKVEPVGFDYLYDDSVNHGEHGYACWDIRVLIDVNETASLDDSDHLKELFPESARNKLSSFRNYTDEQVEIIEGLWEYYHEEASKLSSQFCRVEIVLV